MDDRKRMDEVKAIIDREARFQALILLGVEMGCLKPRETRTELSAKPTPEK